MTWAVGKHGVIMFTTMDTKFAALCHDRGFQVLPVSKDDRERFGL